MSFSPKSMDQQALNNLARNFSRAVKQVLGDNRDTAQLQQALIETLGYTQPRPDHSQALANGYHRGRLWFLLSAQMEAGVPAYQAVQNIRQKRSAMGFPDNYDTLLGEWIKMMEAGQSHGQFFAKYVLPVDMEEARRLIFNCKISSFGEALASEAHRLSGTGYLIQDKSQNDLR